MDMTTDRATEAKRLNRGSIASLVMGVLALVLFYATPSSFHPVMIPLAFAAFIAGIAGAINARERGQYGIPLGVIGATVGGVVLFTIMSPYLFA